jgi:hypothetical protein
VARVPRLHAGDLERGRAKPIVSACNPPRATRLHFSGDVSERLLVFPVRSLTRTKLNTWAGVTSRPLISSGGPITGPLSGSTTPQLQRTVPGLAEAVVLAVELLTAMVSLSCTARTTEPGFMYSPHQTAAISAGWTSRLAPKRVRTAHQLTSMGVRWYRRPRARCRTLNPRTRGPLSRHRMVKSIRCGGTAAITRLCS